jgi:Uncharacterized protein conserved in bacteria (DUF2252)
MGDDGVTQFKTAPPVQVPSRRDEARSVLGSLPAYRSTLSPGRQQVLDAYAPCAVAFRVVGTGSVG